MESELNLDHEPSPSLNEFISPEKFQDIIRERKEEVKEMAKETITHDRELIAEMKSRAENHCLLNRFPKEIWALIMCRLDDAADFANICQVNPSFRHLLLKKEQCQRMLFPQVIHHFLRSSARNMYPHDSKTLDEATTYRSVCKSWRNAVDRFLEENILSSLEGGETSVPTYSVKFLENEESLDRTIQLFCIGPMELRAKQFFLRSLEFKVGHDFDWNTRGETRALGECFVDFSFKVMRLLEVVGDQIWHFSYKILETGALNRNGIPSSQILVILKSMVSNMPNLKWLDIDMGYSRPRSSIDCETKEDEQFAEFARSFPILKDLEKLDFSCKGDHLQNIEILTSVLRANPQIKTLFFFPTIIDEEAERNFLHLLFESLPPMLTGFHLSWLDPVPIQFLQPLKKLHFQP